jgi:NAD(P)-dependent dehydrogenase (short-subunit alcohol dehydrogenase family)
MRCLESADVKPWSKTIATFGRLDYAFNNAYWEILLTADCTEENWDKTIAINLKGIWLCMQHEILEMLKQVKVPSSTASVAGLVGFKGLHMSPQAWRNRINKNSRIEYAKQGIQ